MDTTKTKNAFDALYEFEKNHVGFPKGAIKGMDCLIIKTNIMSKREIKVGDFISVLDKAVKTTFRKCDCDKEITVSVSSRFIKIYESSYIGVPQCIKKFGRTYNTDSAARFICEYLNK